jgi:retron-type reverse transcriptase
MDEAAEAQRRFTVKSWSNLYPRICSLENLYTASRKARKRKTRKEDVERFELHRERFLHRLREELLSARWQPSPYRRFQIHDPKTRTISAAPYRDRVVHHSLCNVIGPVIERRFVFDSYSCRVGKGTEAGRERCRRFTNRYRYVLKCDIRKYFESVDHAILYDKLAGIIRCQPTLALCKRIIDSSEAPETQPVWLAGDELFTPAQRKHGLPIGNLTSQLWANLYLDRLDHVIREDLRPAGYVRYTDDFLLWSNDKGFLHACRERITAELEQERLVLHGGKTRLFPAGCGVPFLGFRFSPGYAPRLIGECKRRFERRMRTKMKAVRTERLEMAKARESALGWKAFADYGNVIGLYRKYGVTGFG